MLIGLSSKNAILIVEFAEQLRDEGLSIIDAAVESARIRLRPILMTSLAFILGVVPLVIAQGRGRGRTRFGGHHGFRRHDRRHLVESDVYSGAVRYRAHSGAAQENRARHRIKLPRSTRS